MFQELFSKQKGYLDEELDYRKQALDQAHKVRDVCCWPRGRGNGSSPSPVPCLRGQCGPGLSLRESQGQCDRWVTPCL